MSNLRSYILCRIIDGPLASYDLTKLCLSYLVLCDVSEQSSTMDVRESLLQGQSGLFDYSLMFWAHHLTSDLNHPDTPKGSFAELGTSLSWLLDEHHSPWSDYQRYVVSETARIHRHLGHYKEKVDYSALTGAVIWAKKLSSVHQDINTHKDCLDLRIINMKAREVLESLLEPGSATEATDAEKQQLHKYYGKNLYRCPRTFCQYFFEGFSTRTDRDAHLDRHDRAYLCEVEGCPAAIVGCNSPQKLEKHILKSHGFMREAEKFPDIPEAQIMNLDDSFGESASDSDEQEMAVNDVSMKEATGTTPIQVEQSHEIPAEEAVVPMQTSPEPQAQVQLSESQTMPARPATPEPPPVSYANIPRRQRKPPTAVRHPKRFACTHCERRFTRRGILRGHERTHSNERPFFCTICGEAFRRNNDRKRHERSHGESIFICQGLLQAGGTWGCGRGFSRRDALEAHWRSEQGWRCERPRLLEQASRNASQNAESS